MGSTPSWGPDESAYEIFLERTFLAADFLSGMGYGMQFILYISCASFLWNARKSRGKQSIYLLIYITVLLCVETMFVAVQARTIQSMYIDNRNYPGGPWRYFLDTQYLVINMFYAMLFILTFLSDLLVLWRCWIVWGGSGEMISYAVVALPFLMVVASFVMGTLWTLQSSHPGLSLYNALPKAFGTSYSVISLSVNILLTILIAARLLFYRRRALLTLPPGHAAHYLSLAAIFVESAALYSIAALAFIVSYALTNPISQIILSIASSSQQISGYLIIYRLAEGRAWNQGTSASIEGNMETLRFHQSTSGGTAITASTNFETPTDGTPFTSPPSLQDQPVHITAEEKKDEEEVSIYIA